MLVIFREIATHLKSVVDSSADESEKDHDHGEDDGHYIHSHHTIDLQITDVILSELNEERCSSFSIQNTPWGH